MSRLFVIEDLRSLAARALATGDYTPAESARVRAVPDTRTIRYYTTLGLLKPPAQMHGRTALYSETHVLQIVAIKRLQADDLSLSDIQRRLVGLTNSRLAKIAKLPEGFWEAADKYLEKASKHDSKQPSTTASSGSMSGSAVDQNCGEEFWLIPAALPPSVAEATPGDSEVPVSTVQAIIELRLASDVRASIQFPSNAQPCLDIDWAALHAAAQPLLKELLRQKIVRH